MATAPQYAATSKSGSATVSTANTTFDGSGAMATVLTGATNGTRIDAIHVAATGTTSAGVVSLFVSNTTAANTTANTDFVRAVSITANTASATNAPVTTSLTTATLPDFLPLFLPSGYTLRAATTVAQSIKVVAQGADF